MDIYLILQKASDKLELSYSYNETKYTAAEVFCEYGLLSRIINKNKITTFSQIFGVHLNISCTVSQKSPTGEYITINVSKEHEFLLCMFIIDILYEYKNNSEHGLICL